MLHYHFIVDAQHVTCCLFVGWYLFDHAWHATDHTCEVVCRGYLLGSYCLKPVDVVHIPTGREEGRKVYERPNR